MAVTPTTVVNQAIELIGGDQSPVTGTYPLFDTSPAGIASAALYDGVVATIGRQFGWDMSRTTGALTLSGNVAPFPWSLEYLYPPVAIQIRQIMPPDLDDMNDPITVNWIVANNVVGGAIVKVIHTDQEDALAVLSNQPQPSVWDPLFRESVVRLLASELAMALDGRPDTARDSLDQANSFSNLGQTRGS